jgi:hypothetical protein
MKTDNKPRQVDMSPEAIDRRLRTVSELRKLGLSIAKAKRIDDQQAVTAGGDKARSQAVEEADSS